MSRRFLAVAIAVIFATAGTTLIAQTPAQAWTQSVWSHTYYSTHGGTLYIYVDGEGHNWGCSAFGLAMDCADGQNVYASASFSDNVYPYTYPSQSMVQASVSFSGQALSVGALGAYTQPYGTTCVSPTFISSGSFVSATTNGVVCHTQTVLSISGMTLSASGYGQWGGAWYGSSTSVFLDMYPA